MGMYNPNAPLILGNEYPGLIQADYRPELFVERGFSFQVESLTQFDWASMFISELPAQSTPGHCYLWTLYRRGQETNTGPMRAVILPISSATLTNAAVVPSGSPLTATQALSNPANNTWVRMTTPAPGTSRVRCTFDVSSVAGVLTDKRIVDVSILYIATQVEQGPSAIIGTSPTLTGITWEKLSSPTATMVYDTMHIDERLSTVRDPTRSRWGEIIMPWADNGSPLTAYSERYPFNYDQLTNFNASDNWSVDFTNTVTSLFGEEIAPSGTELYYVAMQVTYCEENRYAVFGAQFGDRANAPTVADGNNKYKLHQNSPSPNRPLGFIDPQSLSKTGASGGISVTGLLRDLTLTVKLADAGPVNNEGLRPKLRALRSIDPYPGHPGIVINTTLTPGQHFTAETTDLTPQLKTVEFNDGWAQGFAVPWMHVYGIQVPLQVHATSTVVQEIVQDSQAAATEFPQLRFFARSQDASAPLEIWLDNQTQPNVFIGQLTPSEWAALPEIVDGWREVTMPVDPAALIDDDGTILTPATPAWRSNTSPFRAWEVLGVRVNPEAYDAAAPEEVGIGTYGDVFAGQAQGGIEGDLPDTEDIDVVVMWAEELPTIDGLTPELGVQPLEVVDPECAQDGGCIPTGINFTRFTWEPLTGGPEFAGFAAYEIQRRDESTATGSWETIALIRHAAIGQFDDFEARVGIVSTYRIRYVHMTGFTGPWSSDIAATIPVPGITGAEDGNSVLVLTSNDDPSSNLAYIQTWPGGEVTEGFEFVEADTNLLQRMHRRDYQTAFRPRERGGMAFTRSILVNVAGVTPERLRGGFTSLRDLAWADLPYVCVRTEVGDRWLSNVNVPAGRVQRDRTLYMADVTITEVLGDPVPSEPTMCEGLTAAGALPGVVYDPRYASTPASPALDTDDGRIRVEMRLDQIDQSFPLVTRYVPQADTGWEFRIDIPFRTLSWYVSDGFDVAWFESDPLPFDSGDRFWVEVDYQHDVAGVSVAQFSYSTDGGVWTPLATTALIDDPVSMSDAVAAAPIPVPMTVGAVFDGTVHYDLVSFTGASGGWNGVIPHVIVDGDSGTIADVDFEAQPIGSTQFEDAQDNPWNVDGGICG